MLLVLWQMLLLICINISKRLAIRNPGYEAFLPLQRNLVRGLSFIGETPVASVDPRIFWLASASRSLLS